MSWAKEMSEAYSAGLEGRPCPNDFKGCWKQGKEHAKKLHALGLLKVAIREEIARKEARESAKD